MQITMIKIHKKKDESVYLRKVRVQCYNLDCAHMHNTQTYKKVFQRN